MPRIFAVLAAVLLVGSVALASLIPADMNLGQALRGLDASLPESWRPLVARGLWDGVLVPMLVRPVWMIPTCLGLICVGGAVSALSRASPRPTQKRS